MKCGCTATARKEDGSDLCFIHMEDQQIEVAPDISGRQARCKYCNKVTYSIFTLPFFQYRESASEDVFYCGCRGWD